MNNEIYNYLDKIIPNPKCELNYKQDYELLLAVMLSAQTTDKRVNEVTSILFEKYPTIKEMKDASINDIVEIIRPIGTYTKKANNIIKIAQSIYEHCGKVPCDRKYLESLPGVGRKTANVVLSNLYDVPCIAVDTHVERVSKRLGLVRKNADVQAVERKLTKIIPESKQSRMHHQFVLFGRYYCTARNPKCDSCGIQKYCKYYNKKKSYGK